MKEHRHKRIIISGGGTGGHIFPAIAVANALKSIDSSIEILFVGAEGKIEMEKVPAAGYRIIGLPVSGLIRKISLRNLVVLKNLARSIFMARKIISEFKPDVVVGVGGYASGPVLRVAGRRGIPTLIQEQNSYAGVTNKLLARRASAICVAYEGMERFFPADKIIMTGNPVRQEISGMKAKREEGLTFFGLKSDKKVLLVLGGSGGAGTINSSIQEGLEMLRKAGIQLIWQTGKYYYEKIRTGIGELPEGSCMVDFINRMDLAFASADIIVTRAGAGTISELCLVARPVILVPSPNVAEDHQTRNALSLSEKGAALLVTDSEAPQKLVAAVIELAGDDGKAKILSENISRLAIGDADIRIAKEVLKLI